MQFLQPAELKSIFFSQPCCNSVYKIGNIDWNRTPHIFTCSLVSPLSDNIRLLFTFSKRATLHSPHLTVPRSLVSHRLILLVCGSIVMMMVSCRLTWGSIPFSTTLTAPGNENTRLFHSHSTNLWKIAWVCCLMTVHMRHSKSRCYMSYTHMIKSPQDALTKNCTYHWELTGNRNSTFDCKLYS